MSFDVHKWSYILNPTPSTSPRVLESLHLIRANGVFIDHQDDGHRSAFRIFGSKELIPYVRTWLYVEGLQLHYPVHRLPLEPFYNPQETYQRTPQGDYDTSFWVDGIRYGRVVPAAIEIPEQIQVQDGEIQEISSVELPSQGPPTKRRRLRSDEHNGQDNLSCSSTAISISTPTTSILTAANGQNVSCSAAYVETWNGIVNTDKVKNVGMDLCLQEILPLEHDWSHARNTYSATPDEAEDDVIMVPTLATPPIPATPPATYSEPLTKETRLLLKLDKEGMLIEKILVELELLTNKPIKLHSLQKRLSKLRKTWVWGDKDTDALKRSHVDLAQAEGIERASPVTTIA